VLFDIVLDAGRTGKIVPMAWSEPVFVGGTTVTCVMPANQEVVPAGGIKIDDTVLVRRAGDVLDESKCTGAQDEVQDVAEPKSVHHQERLAPLVERQLQPPEVDLASTRCGSVEVTLSAWSQGVMGGNNECSTFLQRSSRTVLPWGKTPFED
jgi:NAD-dependent DNA ligase